MPQRFDIKRRLETPAGVRYGAVDLQTGVAARLQRVPEDHTDWEVDPESFEQVAKILPTLVHPNLVQVLELGIEEDAGYAACVHVEGELLETWLSKRGSFSPKDTHSVARDCLLGLCALEETGLRHGQIDPLRILVLPDDTDRLGARLSEPAFATTVKPVEALVPGEPLPDRAMEYTAPEIIEQTGADIRSDLYSLGCTLYLAITGKPPIKGQDEAETASGQLQGAIVSLTECKRDMPPRTAEWIMSLLARDPAQRPSSAAEALRLLDEILSRIQAPKTVPAPNLASNAAPAPIRGSQIVPAPARPQGQTRPPSQAQAAPLAGSGIRQAPQMQSGRAPAPSAQTRMPSGVRQMPSGIRQAPTRPQTAPGTGTPPKVWKPWMNTVWMVVVAAGVLLWFFVWKPSSSRKPADGGLATNSASLGSASHSAATASAATAQPGLARYVRIEIPGPGTLSLPEVEVFSSGQNIALRGSASQSSTAFNGVAERAIDGNHNGNFSANSASHTKPADSHPWWEVDLNGKFTVDSVTVWNRTDENYAYTKRLDNFQVVVLGADRKELFRSAKMPGPKDSLSVPVSGTN